MTATDTARVSEAPRGDAAFWDRIAEKYARDPVADVAAYEATLAATRAHLKPGDRVIELGCGTGSTALRLADAVAGYHGTDISPEMIRIARAKAEAAGAGNLTFSVGEVEADALAEPASLDVVTSFNHLHLVADPQATIRAAAALLRPGGLFISKTMCLAETWKFRLMRPLIGAMKLVGKAPSVVRFFSIRELESMVTRAGLEIVETADQAYPRRFIVARKP